MTTFKDTKEAIQYANEHIVSAGFFNNITLTATPVDGHQHGQPLGQSVNIVEHLYDWSLTPILQEKTRLFYLFGDFGSGKSGVCKQLVSKLYQSYEENRYTNTNVKPTLPLYFNLSLLTGIYTELDFANKSLAELIEVMFCVTGIPKVAGEDIIKLVRQYPCVVVFDGFDEAVQKLSKNQQNGFINKLLSILPTVQYTKDLMRISNQPVEESTIPDSPSRIVISCRTQLYESAQEQHAFTEAFYSTEMSINGIHNYQAYQLDPLPTSTVQKSFNSYIAQSNKALPTHQQLNQNNDIVHAFLEYLVDLSINPLLLALSKSLLPTVQAQLEKTGTINSAHLFTDLITRLMQRDSSKSIINIKEKQKILGVLALQIWHGGTGFISLENLRQFFFEHYSNYRQIQLGINTGRIELEVALQDLHSAILMRDELDRYRFYHPLIFNYFLALGIFETVLHAKDKTSLTPIINMTINDLAQESLNEDSLIFISQMVYGLMLRRDINGYNHFYAQWLVVCEQVSEMAPEHKNHAEDMWDIVIGDDIPTESILNQN